MRSLGTAVLALLIAGAAQAQAPNHPPDGDARPAEPLVEERAPASLAAEPSEAPEIPAIEPRLAETERPAAEPAAAVAEPFTRGSFWWYVGIIVVAGVILALVT